MVDKYPHLINEWDFKKNKNLDPRLLTVSSNKKAFWICKKAPDHKWQTRVNDRTTRNTKCPYCQNQKASSTNNLELLFPDLAKEWDFKKNILKPDQILPKSNKIVWWICKKKHRYESVPSNRVMLGRGCPYCSGRLASKENNLLK